MVRHELRFTLFLGLGTITWIKSRELERLDLASAPKRLNLPTDVRLRNVRVLFERLVRRLLA